MTEERSVEERAKLGALRLTVAVVVALGVLATSLVAAWAAACANHYVVGRASDTRRQLKFTAIAIEMYREDHRRLPRTLDELRPLLRGVAQVEADGTIHDGWRRPLVYSVEGSRYRLFSRGRDGKPGGKGLDWDLASDRLNAPEAGLPFDEFLFHHLTRGMVMTCFLAAGAAFALVLKQTAPGDLARPGVWWLVAKLLLTGLAALLMAAVLMVLHIPSGH